MSEHVDARRQSERDFANHPVDLDRLNALFIGAGTLAAVDNLIDFKVRPSLTLEEYYQSQIKLLDIVSGLSMRQGFSKASKSDPKISKKYGNQLPRVEEGAHRNASELVHVTFPEVYRAVPLIEAGFDPQDVMDDMVLMRIGLMREYAGKQNKEKRRSRRETITKKLAKHSLR